MAGNVERQFSLLQMLMDAQRPVTLERIRSGFPEYRDAKPAAFHKMFERDKTAIRDLGFELISSTGAFGEDQAYAIDRDASLVTDPGLTPEEAAALGLAVAGARGEGALGAMKLGIASGVASPAGWSVAGPDPDPRVAILSDAITRRKRIRFAYRPFGAESTDREVEPHHLRARTGWYLAGHDTSKGESRTFRLSRIQGSIKLSEGDAPDFEIPENAPTAPHAPWEGDPAMSADVAATGNAAWWIERRALGEVAGEDTQGRVLLKVPVADVSSFASWMAGFGTEAIVLGPPEIRDAVILHLKGVI